MRSYFDHGSRHRPDGSDPIPGIGGGDATAYAWVSFNAGYDSLHNQSVTPSGSHEADVQWYTFITSDTSIFATHTLPTGTPNNAAGDKWVRLLQPGVYVAYAALRWESGTYNRYCYLSVFQAETVANEGTGVQTLSAESQAASSSSLTSYAQRTSTLETIFLPSDFSPSAVKFIAGNLDTGARNIIAGTLGVAYLGGSGFADESTLTVY